MITIETFDYLRLCGLSQRTVTIEIPPGLVPRKGKSRSARARCRRVESDLRRYTGEEFARLKRARFRRDVAVHVELSGVTLQEAGRTVKALCDSLQGPVFKDDRAIVLLDVEAGRSDVTRISACSAREYSDAFDVLYGVRSEAESDEFGDEPNPFISSDGPCSDFDLDMAREHLAEAIDDGGFWPDDLRDDLIARNRQLIDHLERKRVLAVPYGPLDRPGPLSLNGRIWADQGPFGGPACLLIPAPDGGAGSWSRIAEEAVCRHIERWRGLERTLGGEPLGIDIAIGGDHAVFDVDNLARRLLTAMRRVAGSLEISSFRAYRSEGASNLVAVRVHPEKRANDLRWLLGGSPMAMFGFRPDEDAAAHRRRPIDEEIFAACRANWSTLPEKISSRDLLRPER